MPPERRHVLIFEPDARGHAEEWFGHILSFVREAKPPVRVTFAVPRDLVDLLAPAAAALDDPPVAFLPLDETHCARCLRPPLVRAALARWRLMRDCLDATGADEGHFLCIDTLSLPLALELTMGGRRLSGILFRPSAHYRTLEPSRPTGLERLRDARKRLLYPRMLRNPELATVLSLDPYFATFAQRAYHDGGKVVALADPAARLREPSPGPSPFPCGRTAFLLFGELTARKGVLQFLEACAQLDSDTARRAAVLIAGRVAPELRRQVARQLHTLRARRPELWIALDDRRLSSDELAVAIGASDVVVAPYQRFVGSSGVLVWAASALRPVITQNYGLLGRFVSDFGLGRAVDTTDPRAIAAALRDATKGTDGLGFDAVRARAFASCRDGAKFAAHVLGVIQEPPHPCQVRSRHRPAGTTTGSPRFPFVP